MSSKNERNLNITIQNPPDDKDEVIISFSSIFKMLKRYFVIWIAVAIVAAMIAGAYTALTHQTTITPLEAVISFTYNGIEKGLDPAGGTLDVNTLKNPTVIESALTELEMDLSGLENVRRSITVYPINSTDDINRFTVYKSVLDNSTNGNLSAAQALLDLNFYPTQYRIVFSYRSAGLSKSQGIQVLNTVLEKYRDYFYGTYGYNTALGASVLAVDYASYDYSEQVDVFGDTLKTLEKYLKDLADEDTTLFRSTVTGFTFNDLYQAAKTMESIDLDRISSYINVNNLTKDKEASIAYYDYRIESLTRTQASLEEQLKSVEDSIANYEKDQIIIFGNGTEDTDTQVTQASQQYDKMLVQKLEITQSLADAKQNIKYYQSRKTALTNSTSSTKKDEQVEAQLADLNEKVNNLVKQTEQTANDYYENVEFANAYNILVPAVGASSGGLTGLAKRAMIPIVLAEGLVFFLYLAVAFIKALILENSNKKAVEAVGGGSGDDDDDDIDDIEDVIEAITDEDKNEENKNNNKKKSTNKKK